MPTDLLVHPGDLITADLWNRLLAAIDRVESRIDAAEARIVPDVVGDLLGTARDEIGRARLDLSTVLDAEGTRVDLADATLADRIVLAQMPSPEELVRIGRKVTLLITAAKVKKANAPDVTAATVPGGGNAQVGKALELAGTAFTGKIAVNIRNTPLVAGQFTVDSATKITIPKVPSFDGAPTPGATKPIPITVSNEFGNDSLTVNFSEPQVVVATPTIGNIRFRSKTLLSILGSGLNPPIQDVTVTVLNDNVGFKPISDAQMDAQTNDKLQKLFARVDADTFKNLVTIDNLDLFLIDVTPVFFEPKPLDFSNATEFTPLAARRADLSRRDIVLGETEAQLDTEFINDRDVRAFSTTQTIKIFPLLSPALASAVAAAGRRVTVTPNGNRVSVTAGRLNFTIDLTKLVDVQVVVKAGSKTANFTLKIGDVA